MKIYPFQYYGPSPTAPPLPKSKDQVKLDRKKCALVKKIGFSITVFLIIFVLTIVLLFAISNDIKPSIPLISERLNILFFKLLAFL